MTVVLLTDQTVVALADACTALATLRAVGMWDPDMHEPTLSWRRTAEFLRAQLPEPGDDRTAGGQVTAEPGEVVLTIDICGDALQGTVSPAHARQIGRALFHQADRAETLARSTRALR